ncbi:hypothetical protein FBR28_00775 [Salmonella enterica subsp. enterica serovar Newport]|nr:hypothetical protein [Salmonella enterica subsp. enterica serovar Newport]
MKDIVKVISSRVELKVQGKNFIGLCPFHNEKTPSFIVNYAKQAFECLGCGFNGDADDFIEMYNILNDGLSIITNDEIDKFTGSTQ